MVDSFVERFERWLRKIEGEWAGMSYDSLRVDLELETGLQVSAVVVLTTGILGFEADQSPIQSTRLIHPDMHTLFLESKPLQQFVWESLKHTYGKGGGWAEKRGAELADRGLDAALRGAKALSWQSQVLSNPYGNGVVRA